MKKISIVIPIYNEAKNILFLYDRLMKILSEHSLWNYEVIFINDGSKDGSWDIIKQLAQANSRIKGFSLSRNFGHQAALTAAYDHVEADGIISMDADLQDPPELIPAMIEAWDRGFDIVYARRVDRQDSFFKKWTAIFYYRILDCVSSVKIPRNVGDFRLIDKKVLHVLQSCRERSRYLRGMVAWVGFKHTFIDFKRPNRHAGKTGYTWKKMWLLAFDGLTSFSLFPLKLAAFFGIFMVGSGLLMFAYISLDAFWRGVYYPLFKWLITIVYIFMGIQMLLLWLIGEYIGRIYEQQQNRPLYLINEYVNVNEKLNYNHDVGKKEELVNL